MIWYVLNANDFMIYNYLAVKNRQNILCCNQQLHTVNNCSEMGYSNQNQNRDRNFALNFISDDYFIALNSFDGQPKNDEKKIEIDYASA